MNETNKNEGGFTTFLTLSLIMILMLTLSGALFLNSAWKTRAAALERKLAAIEEADTILSRILFSMQSLASDKSDTFNTENYRSLLIEYADYSLALCDVSSGISTKFWSKKITESQPIQRLLMSHMESKYSWLSKNLYNEKILAESLESTGAKNITELFPLVNSFPLTNIYSLDEETMLALLESLKIKDAEQKSRKLFEAMRSETITDKEIMGLLSIHENSQAMAIFGTKTAFWKISFATETCSVRAIIAAVPYKDKTPREAERYIIIEKHTDYRGEADETP